MHHTCFISYFLITVIKHSGKNQNQGQRVCYLDLQFQNDTNHHGSEEKARCREGRHGSRDRRLVGHSHSASTLSKQKARGGGTRL